MDQERGRSRHRVDAIESDPERLCDIFVCLFAESDVAVADLEEGKISRGRQGASCFCDLGESARCEDAAGYRPKQAGPSPGHAMKEAAAIDPVMFVVVRNVIGHNLVPVS